MTKLTATAAAAQEEVVSTKAPVTYLQFISQDEKSVKKEGLAIRAQEASIEVQKEIMGLNSSIAKKTNVLLAAKRQVPYNVSSEYTVTNELIELKAKLAFVQAIKKERFSDVSI